jgi:hypothetical protein
MLNRIGLAAVILAMSAAPALADNTCGSMPIPPALPTGSDIGKMTPDAAESAKHQAFMDIKNWQANLNDYRDCLNSLIDTDKEKMGQLDPTKDSTKISNLQIEIDGATGAHDSSVDAEEKVVNEFHAIQAAFCMRSDVDRATCPK